MAAFPRAGRKLQRVTCVAARAFVAQRYGTVGVLSVKHAVTNDATVHVYYIREARLVQTEQAMSVHVNVGRASSTGPRDAALQHVDKYLHNRDKGSLRVAVPGALDPNAYNCVPRMCVAYKDRTATNCINNGQSVLIDTYCSERARTFWNNQSPFQNEYNWLWQTFVPSRGEAYNNAYTPEQNRVAEVFRLVSRIYYGRFNNGDFSIDNGNFHVNFFNQRLHELNSPANELMTRIAQQHVATDYGQMYAYLETYLNPKYDGAFGYADSSDDSSDDSYDESGGAKNDIPYYMKHDDVKKSEIGLETQQDDIDFLEKTLERTTVWAYNLLHG